MIETSKQIKEIIQAAEIDRLPEIMKQYESDERTSVKSILQSASKRYTNYQNELIRIEKMKEFECLYQSKGYVCGIDEVGRGPLAGPLVAGAVILPPNCKILYLNDSKQLSEKKREELYDIIMDQAIAVGIGYASVEQIDRINVLQADYEAMRDAISKLSVLPQVLLNDAVKIPNITIEQVPIIKGDTKSISIAAASIIAKVTRDRLMVQYDEVYPQYGFKDNKGYGSQMHIDAIKKYGPCPIHRKSFIGHFI